MRLYIRDGVTTCHQCGTHYKVGINLYILPLGVAQTYRLAPDESLPGKESTRNGIRTRSRKSRQAALRSVGLDDAAPQIALERYHGQPIHSVTIVPDPTPDEGV